MSVAVIVCVSTRKEEEKNIVPTEMKSKSWQKVKRNRLKCVFREFCNYLICIENGNEENKPMNINGDVLLRFFLLFYSLIADKFTWLFVCVCVRRRQRTISNTLIGNNRCRYQRKGRLRLAIWKSAQRRMTIKKKATTAPRWRRRSRMLSSAVLYFFAALNSKKNACIFAFTRKWDQSGESFRFHFAVSNACSLSTRFVSSFFSSVIACSIHFLSQPRDDVPHREHNTRLIIVHHISEMMINA